MDINGITSMTTGIYYSPMAITLLVWAIFFTVICAICLYKADAANRTLRVIGFTTLTIIFVIMAFDIIINCRHIKYTLRYDDMSKINISLIDDNYTILSHDIVNKKIECITKIN